MATSLARLGTQAHNRLTPSLRAPRSFGRHGPTSTSARCIALAGSALPVLAVGAGPVWPNRLAQGDAGGVLTFATLTRS
jgi:hypothetical protein